jgi:hypothetical protein
MSAAIVRVSTIPSSFMRTLHRLPLLIASLISCSAQIADAQVMQLIAGEIVAVQGTELRVKDTAGHVVALRLGDQSMITVRSPIRMDTIAPGSYVGTTASPRGDGLLIASEVHVFAEAMRGVGEGHRPMDRLPGSTMTNATVKSVARATQSTARGGTTTEATVANVAREDGMRRLVLDYNGGQQTVLVEESTPVTLLEPGQASMLVPGARVAVVASQHRDGALVANRINIGMHGYVPSP